MRHFHCAALATVAAVSFASVASAADMPVKAPIFKAAVPATAYSWTGFYIGANVGGGWGNRSVDYTANDAASSDLLSGGLAPLPVSFNMSGVIGGLQFGYNWQLNRNWLGGLETDFDGSGMKGSGSITTSGIPTTNTVDEHIKWFGTVRARLGYLPMDDLLVYLTGGFAYGQADHTGNYVNNSIGSTFSFATSPGYSCLPGITCFTGSSSKVAAGWTLGGGFEYAFWQKWSLKAEYLYVSLDSASVTETATVPFVVGGAPASFNANFGRANFNVARLGVNYRF